MTKQIIPCDVHVQCYKWTQMLHSHYLQTVGQDSLNKPSWLIFSLLSDGVQREVGEEFRMGGHMHSYAWFMLMYGKSRYNIVK